MNIFRFTQSQYRPFFSFMTYHRLLSNRNTTGATSGIGIAYTTVVPQFAAGCCCSLYPIPCFPIFNFVLCPLPFPCYNDIKFVFTAICVVGDHVICIFHVYWCPTRFPYQMIFVSLNRNTTDATNDTGTDNSSRTPEFILGFQWGYVRVAKSLVLCVKLCGSLSFCLFLAIVLFVLRLTASYYPISIFKLLLTTKFEDENLFYL